MLVLIVTSMRSIVAWMLSLGLLTRQADDGAGIAGAGAPGWSSVEQKAWD